MVPSDPAPRRGSIVFRASTGPRRRVAVETGATMQATSVVGLARATCREHAAATGSEGRRLPRQRMGRSWRRGPDGRAPGLRAADATSILSPCPHLDVPLSLVVFGVLGYHTWVDQFPDGLRPTVAAFEGAGQVVGRTTDPSRRSSAFRRSIETSVHGATQIKIEFEPPRHRRAAQDVRDKVALARFDLPKEVEPPIVMKDDTGSEPVLWLPINSDRPLVEVSEFVKRTVKPRLETVPGVASTELFGERARAIRLWLDGDALRSHGLAASDVLAAVQREHVDVPGGRVESDRIDYTVRTDAEFRSVAELEDLIVAWAGDAPVRLREVARVEDGSVDAQTMAHFDGVPTVGIGIRKQSDANTVAVVDEVGASTTARRDPGGLSFHAGKAGFENNPRGGRDLSRSDGRDPRD
jgi:hypothetical protein